MTTTGVRVAVAVLLLSSFGCHKSSSTPASPTPPSSGAPIAYTAVGASDAIGIGASVSCTPYAACPNGTGYVPVIARQLQAGGVTVSLMNLGIPAAVIGPGFQAIAKANGRDVPGNFLEQEMPFVPKDSTVVTVFAGGNDVNTIADAVNRGAGGSNPDAYVAAEIQAFTSDYLSLVKGIKSRAPNAWIVVANLPNLAGLPYASGYSGAAKQLMQRLSVGFTTQGINTLVSQSVPVVDLMCDARSYDPGIYSADGFHPNDAGYAYIASAFLEAIRTNNYRAPSGSCAQMTLAK